MQYIITRPHSGLNTIAFTIFLFLLMANCHENNKVDYADALQKCTDENAVKGSGIFLPNPECVVGARFPRFECMTIDHKKINEDYFKGKVSIVNFWFEGCAPCVAEVPGFNQLVHKYGKDKLRYVAISSDNQEDVEAFLKNHDWDFDHVSNGKSIVNDIFHLPWGYPTTFLVDQQGIIAKTVCGGKTDSTAVAAIQEHLAPWMERLLKGN